MRTDEEIRRSFGTPGSELDERGYPKIGVDSYRRDIVLLEVMLDIRKMLAHLIMEQLGENPKDVWRQMKEMMF
jgi:hypothetical protein